MSKGGKNGYLKQRRAEIEAYRQAEKETYIQYMTDMLMVTLNDPEAMGKDVFGVSAPFENVDFRRNGVSFLTGQHTGVIQP